MPLTILLPNPLDMISRPGYNSGNQKITGVTSMDKPQIHLSDNEWRIMQVLWDGAPRTLRQICDAVKHDAGWTKHAVISFLKRLQAKGAVRAEETEPARLYFPMIGEEDALGQETKSVLDRVYRGNISLMVSNAVSQKNISEQDIEELMGILRQAKGREANERNP